MVHSYKRVVKGLGCMTLKGFDFYSLNNKILLLFINGRIVRPTLMIFENVGTIKLIAVWEQWLETLLMTF